METKKEESWQEIILNLIKNSEAKKPRRDIQSGTRTS